MKLKLHKYCKTYFAAANLFKHPHTVIWEYVTNEIQYREKGTKPEVHVIIEEDKIIIKGNGEGMDMLGLKISLHYMEKINTEKRVDQAGENMVLENLLHLQLQKNY